MKHPKEYYRDKLTIVLPLLNREAFTVRYLNYLESIDFPFQVIIADGGPDQSLQHMLEIREIAPKVRYAYVRFPQDTTFLDYYSKMRKAAELVQTPYVMLNDNDDFPIVSGLIECIDFLDQSSEYVGASGKIGGVRLKEIENVINLIELDFYSYPSTYIESFEQDNGLARIQHQITKNKAYNLYYAIYRIAPLQKILLDLEQLNFQDLRLHELYFIQGVLVLGKVRFVDGIYTYFRQRGTSQGTVLLRPWAKQLFFESWEGQFVCYLDLLVQRIIENETENLSVPEMKNIMKEGFLVEIEKRPFFERHSWQKIRYPYTYYSKIISILRKIFLGSNFVMKLENKHHQNKFLSSAGSQKLEVEGIIKQLQA